MPRIPKIPKWSGLVPQDGGICRGDLTAEGRSNKSKEDVSYPDREVTLVCVCVGRSGQDVTSPKRCAKNDGRSLIFPSSNTSRVTFSYLIGSAGTGKIIKP